MNDKRVLIIPILFMMLFILIGCNTVWEKEKFEGKQLGIVFEKKQEIVATNKALVNFSNVEREFLGNSIIFKEDDLTKLNKSLKDLLKNNIILNTVFISDIVEIDKSVQKDFKNRYNIDFLLIIDISYVSYSVLNKQEIEKILN